jgi:prolyl-tRNA synthetase
LLKARTWLQESTVKAVSMSDIRSAIGEGKMAFSPWCGEAKCEARVKEETGAKSLNIPFEQPSHKEDCFCGKKAQEWVYFAKSY